MALGVEQIIAEPAEIEWCQVSSGEMMVLEAMPVGEIEPIPAGAPAPETGSWDPPTEWGGEDESEPSDLDPDFDQTESPASDPEDASQAESTSGQA
jgi:hypothetical protein